MTTRFMVLSCCMRRHLFCHFVRVHLSSEQRDNNYPSLSGSFPAGTTLQIECTVQRNIATMLICQQRELDSTVKYPHSDFVSMALMCHKQWRALVYVLMTHVARRWETVSSSECWSPKYVAKVIKMKKCGEQQRAPIRFELRRHELSFREFL